MLQDPTIGLTHKQRRDVDKRPSLSIVIVLYNIPREAARSLHALSAAYQCDIDPADYEVIVVDNGSDPPFDPSRLRLTGHFRHLRIDDAHASPAQAANRGLALARGDVVGVMIDGARLVTPGLLHFARAGAALFPRAVVATLGWYVGYDLQNRAIAAGWNANHEDALLRSIDWPADGYRLFEIGTLDESSVDGWVQPISESNALFMPRALWDELGGYDERFDLPGGGMLNLDLFSRALELPETELVLLLGEATFHQLHGGVSTNAPAESAPANWERWGAQDQTIRGRPWDFPSGRRPTYLGRLPRHALARFARAVVDPIRPVHHGEPPPLGPDFDRGLWSLQPAPPPSDPVVARLVALAQCHFRNGIYADAAAVARLARARGPHEPEALRLLSLVGSANGVHTMDEARKALFHVHLGEAGQVLGDHERARQEFAAALAHNPDLVSAHIGLASLRMPGEGYYAVLERFHRTLTPEVYVEIGIGDGSSLALARPPTVAVAVDPSPVMSRPVSVEAHVYAETSDDFFRARDLPGTARRPAGSTGLHRRAARLRGGAPRLHERRAAL